MRPTISVFHLILILTVTGLTLGCDAKKPPAAADGEQAGGNEPKANPAPIPLPKLTNPAPKDEDPEVAAYLKSKGWRTYRDWRISDRKQLTYLTIEDSQKSFEDITITDDDYKMIAKTRKVQVLDLRRVKCTDAGLQAIGTNKHLEGIIVSGEDVTDEGIKGLANCKTLDNVALFNTKKVTDAGVKALSSLPKIQSLYLAFMTLDGSAFEAFAGANTLTSLTLEYVDGFTDAGAAQIAKLPSLNELKIQKGFGESKLTAAGIKAIVDVRLPAKFEFDKKLLDDALFESLVAKGWLYGPTPPGATDKRPATAADVKFISLDDSKVTDKGFAAVLNCTNVTSLHLRRTGITDETFKKLGEFKNLDYLSLEMTKVTAVGLNAVAELPIKHLAMEGCELNEDTFKAMGKLPSLEQLWLSNAKMKAAWLQHLSTLPKLKEINLLSADFDDAAVKYVMTMPNLEDLTVNSTQLGDAGFQELLKHPKLKKLYVDGTKVTKEVYQKAKADYPKKTFYFYRYDS